MSVNPAVWTADDDDKPWESDKLTDMQERMLMLGHFPELMPDKRPTQDDLTMQAKVALDETRERRTEILTSRASNLPDEAMSSTRELALAIRREGDISGDGINSIEGIRDKTLQSALTTSHVNTHGVYLNRASESAGANTADSGDNSDDDEDSLFGDEEEERALEAIRRKRIEEMKMHAMATTIRSAVKEIRPEEFEVEAKAASHHGPVAMLLFLDNHLPSQMMIRFLETLAKKFTATKFIKMKASDHIANFPAEDSPTLMIYKGGNTVTQFVTLGAFHGPSTTVDDVEWALHQVGVVNSDMTEDPRESALFTAKRG